MDNTSLIYATMVKDLKRLLEEGWVRGFGLPRAEALHCLRQIARSDETLARWADRKSKEP